MERQSTQVEQAYESEKRKRLTEQVEGVVAAERAQVSNEVIELFVESLHFDARILTHSYVARLTEKWSFQDKRRYAEACGIVFDLEWDDTEFDHFTHETMPYGSMEFQIGVSAFSPGTAMSDTYKNKGNLQINNHLRERDYARAFAKNYINDLIKDFDNAKDGEAVEVEGRYGVSKKRILSIENTQENRARILRLRDFIYEYERRDVLVITGLIMFIDDTSNVRA